MHFPVVRAGWKIRPHFEASMGVIEALSWAFGGLKNDSDFLFQNFGMK
jgi:hypothetical protein